jgi:hypothetical protein
VINGTSILTVEEVVDTEAKSNENPQSPVGENPGSRSSTEAAPSSTPAPAPDASPSQQPEGAVKTDFSSPILEIMNISHNQTTLRLPDTLGGVLFLVTRDRYSGNSTRWESLSIPAGAHSYTVMHLRPGTEYLMRWNTPDSMTPVASFRTQGICFRSNYSIITVYFLTVTFRFVNFVP